MSDLKQCTVLTNASQENVDPDLLSLISELNIKIYESHDPSGIMLCNDSNCAQKRADEILVKEDVTKPLATKYGNIKSSASKDCNEVKKVQNKSIEKKKKFYCRVCEKRLSGELTRNVHRSIHGRNGRNNMIYIAPL